MSALPTVFDGPWKETLEALLPECLAFCFPVAHAGIDWAAGFTFLDKELQQVAPSNERSQQTVDKLVAVNRNDGTSALVYLHLEVQSQRDADFAERVYRYHARLFDRFRAPIATLAILGDEHPTWHPRSFGYDLWGCQVLLSFPTVKLRDFAPETLATSDNPCALIIWAHRAAQDTRRSVPERAAEKIALLRRLIRLGYDSKRMTEVYRLIDWLVQVPPEEDAAMTQQLAQEEGEARYVPFLERFYKEQIDQAKQQASQARQQADQARQQADQAQQQADQAQQQADQAQQQLVQGLYDGIATVLEVRFGEAGSGLQAEIAAIHDATVLRAVLARLKTAQTIDEVRAVYKTPD